jgi:hypothetical protein
MAECEKKVRKKLTEFGCYFLRHEKGDHVLNRAYYVGEGSPLDIWFKPITKLPINVDGDIFSRHVANGIMTRAGIKFHF